MYRRDIVYVSGEGRDKEWHHLDSMNGVLINYPTALYALSQY